MVSTITLAVTDENKTDQVIEEITRLLRTRHRLGTGVEDDFNIRSMEELGRAADSQTDASNVAQSTVQKGNF